MSYYVDHNYDGNHTLVTVYVDTTEDVITVDTNYSPGSLLFVVNESKIYMLNNSKVWVLWKTAAPEPTPEPEPDPESESDPEPESELQ